MKSARWWSVEGWSVVYQEMRFFPNASMEVESPFVVQIYPGVLDPLTVL
jgi:hypothetical protein